MANELDFRARLTVSKSGVAAGARTSELYDLVADPSLRSLQRQTIGTTAESLGQPALESASLIYIENLDTDNFVLVRSGAAAADENDYLVLINPGEFAFFSPAADAFPIKLLADTAPVDIQYVAVPE